MAAASIPITSLPSHHNVSLPSPTTSITVNNDRYFSNHPTILLINQCSNSKQLKQIHAQMLRNGLFSDPFSASTLVSAFAISPLQDIDYAHKVFDEIPQPNIYTWNTLIRAYSSSQVPVQSLSIFTQMLHRCDQVLPNKFTYPFVIKAAAELLDMRVGEVLHGMAVKMSLGSDGDRPDEALQLFREMQEDAKKLFDKMPEKDIVSWTTMIVGYAKSGNYVTARRYFDAMPNQDIAAWNALISAYEQSGNPKEALAIFNELRVYNEPKPDTVTLVSTLSACAQVGAMDMGRWIHGYIKKHGVKLSCHLITSLIDMYSKCGDLNKALEVFYSVDDKDVFIWSAMVAGLAMHGRGRDAIDLFDKMQEANVKPNAVTFTNLLCACSHTGLVEEGRDFFKKMQAVYGVVPGVKHYACMVDMLGRAGRLDEAIELINVMPMPPLASVWGALLGACKLHGNVEVAEQASSRLLELEPWNHGAYVLLSNIYAKSGKWDKVEDEFII
ncbi:hypothetical protein L6452_42815 [Arctium lappa]|uniref:Uncharacterized protein n=1 Tax=Arctium lappa TaxID=4217 RepID=A0ACB8XKF2_ARCLA|nr:hypothetical protein L6452_42815 [Arctium lappa]